MKIAIYTCLVGHYDDLRDPEIVKEEYDYICYTNNYSNDEKKGIWSIRSIPFEHHDKRCLSRYVKLNPHKVLSDYEYSVYMDSNLCIIDDEFYTIVENLIENDVLMSSVMHPDRNCIYDEIKECIKRGRDNYFSLRKVFKFLQKNGFPKNYGLYENNLIFRAHNNNLVKLISEQWWNYYLNLSRRDQLSLCYVLWKNNFKPILFFPSKINTHNSSCIKRVPHVQKGFVYNTKLRFKIHVLNPILKVLFPL